MINIIDANRLALEYDFKATTFQWMSGNPDSWVYNVTYQGCKNWKTGDMDILTLGQLIVLGNPEKDEDHGYRFVRHDGQVIEDHYEADEDEDRWGSFYEEVIADNINGLIDSILKDWTIEEDEGGEYIKPHWSKIYLTHNKNKEYFLEGDFEKVLVFLSENEVEKLHAGEMPEGLALGIYQYAAF